LKKKLVWSIVIYTDEAVWRKPVPDQFCYDFSLTHQKQCFHFDVIKVKAEKSGELIQKHSLLCKLLALKANDEGTVPEQLIYAIYHATALLKEQLTADQLLLIEQWVDFYKKVPEPVLKQIKQEVKMELVETTISEHIYNQGKAEGKTEGLLEGEAKGKTEGKAEGLLEGQLAALEHLHRQGILSKAQRNAMVVPLRQQLKQLRR